MQFTLCCVTDCVLQRNRFFVLFLPIAMLKLLIRSENVYVEFWDIGKQKTLILYFCSVVFMYEFIMLMSVSRNLRLYSNTQKILQNYKL